MSAVVEINGVHCVQVSPHSQYLLDSRNGAYVLPFDNGTRLLDVAKLLAALAECELLTDDDIAYALATRPDIEVLP